MDYSGDSKPLLWATERLKIAAVTHIANFYVKIISMVDDECCRLRRE
jgi:hypothetical protein